MALLPAHRTGLWTQPHSIFLRINNSGCRTCDNGVWDRSAGGYSCGARISWAMIVDQETQADACAKVADQYPQCVQCTYCNRKNAGHAKTQSTSL
jgi:hypothetical protein